MADYNLGTAHGTVKIDSDTTGVDKANQSLDNLGKKGNDTGQALKTVGSTMGVAGLAIAGGLGLAIKSASDFGAQLSGIAAVGGKEAAARMDEIHDKALDIGKATTFSASEAAQAMSELVKAGIPVADVLSGAADATVSLAAATGVDMPTAATIASNAMNVFGIKAADMGGTVDILAKTANASAIDIGDLGMSMQQVGAVANLAGLDLKDTAIAIGEMGDAGIKGSDAGTSLKTMLMNLQPSTKKQRDLMSDLGIITEDGSNKFYDQAGHLKNLRDIQDILSTSMANMTDAQKQAALETMFGSDAIRAGAVLVKNGAAGYDEFTGKLNDQASAQEQAKIRQDNMKGSLEQLMGSLQNTGIVVGEVLIPPLRELLGWVQSLFDWFSNLPGPMQTFITYAGAGAAAVLLLGSGIIKVVGFFSKMSEAISTIIGALTRKNVAEAESAAVSETSGARTAAAWVGAKLKAVGAWIAMAASAAYHALQVATIWIAETARATAAAVASWVAAKARIVAEWAAMALAAVANAVKTGAIWVAESAAATAALVASWAAAALKAAAQWVAMAAAATANALVVAGAWLLQNGVAVATSLASLAVAVVTTVAGWVAMAVGATVNALIVAAAWLIAFWPVVLIVAVVAAAVALIIVYWDEIVAAFKAGAQWISDAINAAWQWIQQAWDWILQKFQEAWDGIVRIFQGIGSAISDAWNAIVEAFKQAGQAVLDALNATWEWIKGVWDNVIGFFKQIPGWIKGVFTGAISWLVNFGSDILNGLWNGIKNIWNSVTGWFGQIGGWIKSAFSGALNWLVSAGGDLIKGLWNGIVSVKDWILGKIGGFVKSIIGGIKDFFGIGSPSKETAWVGEMLSQGLGNGILDNARHAVNAAVSTAQQVMSAMQDTLDGGAALNATIGSNLTPGALAGLRGAAPTLGGSAGATGAGLSATAGTRASDTKEGTDAEFQRIVKMEFNTYNPVAERASDNEARKIRAAAAVGVF